MTLNAIRSLVETSPLPSSALARRWPFYAGGWCAPAGSPICAHPAASLKIPLRDSPAALVAGWLFRSLRYRAFVTAAQTLLLTVCRSPQGDQCNRKQLFVIVTLLGEVPCLCTFWVRTYWCAHFVPEGLIDLSSSVCIFSTQATARRRNTAARGFYPPFTAMALTSLQAL